MNFCLSLNVIVGVIVVGYSTTTLPLSTTPEFTCPDLDDLVVYDYFDSDYFTLEYPVDGDDVLKGSDAELSLPTYGPQEIVLFRENVGFLDLRFSVRNSPSVTLKLTLANLTTMNIDQPAATDAVS